MASIDTVNVGRPQPDVYAPTSSTGINKVPQSERVEVRAPGAKITGLGSGIIGDFIGDLKHHGGDSQALYSFQREDLDVWQGRLGREVTNGYFGENLTTVGIDVNEARLGEIWRVGDTVELQVTVPRIPCNTFRGWVDERGWLRTFTLAARPGAYLRVVTGGTIGAGDRVTVIHQPEHDVTISLAFRALTTERELLPALLDAGEYLDPSVRATVEADRAVRPS